MNFNLKKTALALLLTGTVALMSFSGSNGAKRTFGESQSISNVQTSATLALAEEAVTPLNVARWIQEAVNRVLEAVTTRTCEPEFPEENLARMKSLSTRKMNQL